LGLEPPFRAEDENMRCACDRCELERGEHYITCPQILTPEVLQLLGFIPKRKEARMAVKKTSKKVVKKMTKKNIN
jgi:hypothetical protein